MTRLAAALILMLWSVTGSVAQDRDPNAPALLVADEVFVTADRVLVAQGNVEAYQGTTRLLARRITYDQASDRLTIEGPIRIDDGDGVTVLASSAELDADLQSGLLGSARLVLNDQLQLAATQMTRVGGRYTQLFKTSVTSCHVCEEGKPPLWQIRARRVIHDQQERQLYFEDAQLRVLSVPIFYFPRLRLPDPTLPRARGFLIPEIQTTSQLGTGVKVPYFIPLGDHADLTLAPYWSPSTRTVDFRYRQAFRAGRIEFDGALTRDDLRPSITRGYLFGLGGFDLVRDYRLDFDLKAVTDDAYLKDYGITDLDRLRSDIALTRTSRDRFFGVALTHVNSLRDTEDDDLLPTIIGDVRYEQRFFPKSIGGEVRTTLIGHGHARSSDEDMLGRDVLRATGEAMWLRSWVLPAGLRTDVRLGLAADAFDIRQDSAFPDPVGIVTPQSAVTFRLPMSRRGEDGLQTIEPLFQIGWTSVQGGDVPNDESNLVEFDEGNLLSLSRFPAEDRREDGLVMAYGFNWSRTPIGPGWEASAAFGQVLRREADTNFTNSSGLAGTSSDYLIAGQLVVDDNLVLTGRTIFDERFDFAKAEVRGAWEGKRGALSGTYLWLEADPDEERTADSSEIFVDGLFQINNHWSATANWRYDIADTNPTRAGIGIGYRNECVDVNLTVGRRFTSSTTVEPSTIFGFTISVRGFGFTDGVERYKSSCNET